MLLAKVVAKEHFYLELCCMKGGYWLQIHSFKKGRLLFLLLFLVSFRIYTVHFFETFAEILGIAESD